LRVDIYHIWCDLKDGVGDLAFCEALEAYLSDLKRRRALVGYRLTRHKLGLGPAAGGEFHVMIEFTDLAQLDRAFGVAATRAEPIEGLHKAVYSKVENLSFALYRDFPDGVRRVPGPSENP
jgi:Family of unknown function (DUF6614)